MFDIFNSLVTDAIRKLGEGYFLVVDSGHGWLTGGKRSIDGSLRENEFNTGVEDKLTLLLSFSGLNYEQTAPGWKDEGLQMRKVIENKLFLDAKKDARQLIGVSIHADAFKADTSANGFCVYYYKKGSRESTKGKILARCIADKIIESDKKNGYDVRARHSSGIKGQNYFMLRETKGVWVLIENAFMTNPEELKLLKNDKFRNDRAYAIFRGILNYLKNYKKSLRS